MVAMRVWRVASPTSRHQKWARKVTVGRRALSTRDISEVDNFKLKSSLLPTSVSLLTSDPTQVTQQDLTSRLPTIPYTPEINNIAPVFLISQAFAPWLRNSPSFLQSLVAQTFREVGRNSGEDVDVDAVLAVVDKLPSPSSANESPTGSIAGKPVRDFQTSYCEGLSVLLSDKDALFGSVIKSDIRRDVSAPELEPILVYDINCPSGGSSVSTQVAVPVANTVFTTGQPHTLIATRWRFSQGSGEPLIQASHNLANCRIQAASSVSKTRPSVPLHAITRPRRVDTSMGNVISRLSLGEGKEEKISASKELEMILPKYTEEHNLQHERLAVWALVMPCLSKDVNNKGSEAADDRLEAISDSIIKGARLHRVTGGGGGWGKKQGLLVLDPEYSPQNDRPLAGESPIGELLENNTEYRTSGDSLDDLATLLQSTKADFRTPLTVVAQKGDLVQFFVAPLDRPDSASPKSTTQEDLQSTALDHNICIFGVLHDADITPGPSSEAAPERNRHEPTLLQNHFGALSTKSVTLDSFEQRDSEKSLDESRTRRQEIFGTKIDVPGSKVVIEY